VLVTDLVKLLGVLLPLTGSLLLLMAARQFVRTRRFLRSSVATSGTVVGEIRQPDGESTFRFPRVSFRTQDGGEVIFQSKLAVGAAVEMGASIPVRYLSDRPEKAEVDSFASRWLPTIVFGALGDAFLTVGLGLWFGWIPV
jgi:hypothetical protein